MVDLIEDKNLIDRATIEKATQETLELMYNQLIANLNSDEPIITKENQVLLHNTLRDIERDPYSGRLIVPALWKHDVSHLLAHNYKLAASILNSQRKRLSDIKLRQYDDVIREQISSGVIEQVSLSSEVTDRDISFLPHSAVFRRSATSTKCRVVFLSNLKVNSSSLSHNQISKPGINLNHKLQIALLLLRFDKYMVTFDLQKAFLQLLLGEEDKRKLRFLWFKDVSKHDFTIVAYKMCRVPFGMKFSPFLLMISLYYILMHDCMEDSPKIKTIKQAIYDLAYVDNLAFSSDCAADLTEAVNVALSAFAQYGFALQQFASNHSDCNQFTAELTGEQINNDVKLLGMIWSTKDDSLRTRKPSLNADANTKRSILSSIQSNFDPFGINLPILNRAKLFLHHVQSDSSLGWDTVLDGARVKEWVNISRQVNKADELTVPRSVGSRSGEFSLLVYCDASKDFIGCVVYLRDVATGSQSLVLARNNLVSGVLKNKSIPMLELAALQFGVETMMDLYQSLTSAVRPINVIKLYAFTDSIISLCWIRSKEVNHDKIEKKNVFINNKLNKISALCEVHPVQFDHVVGKNNPSDLVTRVCSERQLTGTNYLYGPVVSAERSEYAVMVPPRAAELSCSASISRVTKSPSQALLPLDRFSSFKKSVRCMSYVYKFIYLKCNRNPKFRDGRLKAANYLLRKAQEESFPSTIESLDNHLCTDPLISQLNLFLDDDRVIRVQSKLNKLKSTYGERCPVLLHKNSLVSNSIIWDIHLEAGHSGIYKTLSLLRKEFWVTNAFVVVKNVLKSCIICRRLNNRTVKINQNAYRDFRVNPEAIPFRNICLDHCGPFLVKTGSANEKVYVLVISCFWSRAVNLVVCKHVDKDSFLRALQLHVFEHGIPSIVVSDNGTPIVAGMKQTIEFLKDPLTHEFLQEHNIKLLDFQPFPAGASELGGFVEALVKQVKRLINSSIRNHVLSYFDFEFFIARAKMLINKRPIALHSNLCKLDSDMSAVGVLTPEMIVKGREIAALNVLPPLHGDSDAIDGDFILDNNQQIIIDRYKHLRKVSANLDKLYQSEFLSNLFRQAIDRKLRYKLRTHTELKPGDVVSIKTMNSKPFDYPLALVVGVEKNDLGEVVAASLRKANLEVVRRHASDIIFLSVSGCVPANKDNAQLPVNVRRSERLAAKGVRPRH